MENETDTPLAGGSEETSAALSQDDAASLIEGILDDPPEEDAPEGEKPSDEPDQPKAEGEEPEAEPKAAPKDAKAEDDDPEVILRDNSKVKLSDLKRIAGDVAGEQARFQAKIQAVTAEFEQKAAQIAQQERLVQDFLPIIQAQIPPPPTQEQWDSDPIAAIQQEREHNAAVGRLRAMQAQASQRQQQLKAQQQEAFRKHVETHAERLYQKLPELKDETKKSEFMKDMFRELKSEEFSDEEIGNINDSRVFPLIRDAIAYRKLMSQKPVAEKKVAAAVPVATPTRRVMPAQAEAEKKNEAFERLRKSGRPDDAVAALKALL